MKVFGKQSLNVTKEGLALIKQKLADELRCKQKLLLVLDLDHTVVHASIDPRAKACVDNVSAIEFELNDRMHYVKLRPGVHSFLECLNPFFDIQIFTWGTRHYAEKIVGALDPDGQIIKGRITARDDIGEQSVVDNKLPPQKQLERLLPVCESMALILDDSASVWRDLLPNLIEIRKFIYFPIKSEYAHGQANTACPSSVFLDDSFDQEILQKNERDNVLPSIQKLLIHLHQEYYSSPETADVRELLRSARSKILRKVEIVFTGIIPLGTELMSSREARLAQDLGATVVTDLRPTTTHLVGVSRQKTSKCKEAESMLQDPNSRLRHIVHLDWLMACAAHFARVREHDFDLHSYSANDPSMISYLDMSKVSDESMNGHHPESPALEKVSLPSRKRARAPEESKSSYDNNESEDYHESDFERDFEVFMSQSNDAP